MKKLNNTPNKKLKTTNTTILLKLFYGMGQIPNSMKSVIFGIFSLYFYSTVLGLPGKTVGIATACGLIWDAIIDPVIGGISDSTKGKFGKRHGFMIVGAIGMGIAFWAFFSPPAMLKKTDLFLWLLLMNIVLRTIYSVFSIPYYALGAELSDDYDERTVIAGLRGAMGLLGTMAAAVLPFLLFFPNLENGIDPKFNRNGYSSMGLFIGILTTLIAFVTVFGTFSKRHYLPSTYVRKKKYFKTTIVDFFKQTAAVLWNQSFCILFFSYSLFFLGTVINALLSMHFLTYYVRIHNSKATSFFQFCFYISALLGVAFWLKFSKYIEKQTLYFVGALVTSVAMALAYFLFGEGHILGIGNLTPLLIGNGLVGFFASILWIIPTSMIADVVDLDELTHKCRREGSFFGMFYFGEQIAAGIALVVAGILIDSYAGVVPGNQQQSDLTIERIGVLYGIIPSVLVIISAILILKYTLNKKMVKEIQLELKSTINKDMI